MAAQPKPLPDGGFLARFYVAFKKATNGRECPLLDTVHHTLKDEKGEPSFIFHEMLLVQIADSFWGVAVGRNEASEALLTHELIALKFQSGDVETCVSSLTHQLSFHKDKSLTYLVRLRGGRIASNCKRLKTVLGGQVADPLVIDETLLVQTFINTVLRATPRRPHQAGF